MSEIGINDTLVKNTPYYGGWVVGKLIPKEVKKKKYFLKSDIKHPKTLTNYLMCNIMRIANMVRN